jgi:hypothetical protein
MQHYIVHEITILAQSWYYMTEREYVRIHNKSLSTCKCVHKQIKHRLIQLKQAGVINVDE